MKLTTKQLLIANLLKGYKDGVTCYQLIEDNKDTLTKNNIDVVKINSVNATLASLATKQLVSKKRIAYKEKIATRYTIGKELLQFITAEKEK